MQSSEPIDVMCPVPPGLSLLLIERCLFSIVHQSYRPLYVSILVDGDAERDVARIVEGFDWSGFPRVPLIIRYPAGLRREGARRTIGFARAEHRFVGIVDVGGTLYAQAYQTLLDAALKSRAAIVYGDTIIKDMREFETFVYEQHRQYRGTAPSGALALCSGSLPPLGACLLDRDRISLADLAFDQQDCNAAFVFRLLSRYPARRVAGYGPICAHHRDAAAEAIGQTHGRRSSDRLMHAFRELRRRLMTNQ